MDEDFSITLSADDIARKTDSEKLSILLSIAMSNHSCLRKHGEILFGNGKEGICDKVRQTRNALLVLWGLFIGACGAFAGFMFELARK